MHCFMRETRIMLKIMKTASLSQGLLFNIVVTKPCSVHLEGLVLESCACQSTVFTARSLVDWGDATHTMELILCFVLKAGLHKRRGRSPSRNQKRRAYDLVKTAFRFRLRLCRLRSAYDLVKTRCSDSEAEAE